MKKGRNRADANEAMTAMRALFLFPVLAAALVATMATTAAARAQGVRSTAGTEDLRRLKSLFSQTEITLDGVDTACHRMTAFMALTGAQRALGLMHVRELPADHGMLFVYGRPRTVSMYMRNTLIPLDMVFVAESGAIVRVERDTEPLSERSILSGAPALAVLEVNAGVAARLGLARGGRVLWPALE